MNINISMVLAGLISRTLTYVQDIRIFNEDDMLPFLLRSPKTFFG
jgi:hypothetical protein